MNEQEAIKDLKSYADSSWGGLNDTFNIAIEALEKQIAKKPVDISKNPKEWHIMSCPVCERSFWNSGQFMRYMPKWCEKCGQKIDWTVEE